MHLGERFGVAPWTIDEAPAEWVTKAIFYDRLVRDAEAKRWQKPNP